MFPFMTSIELLSLRLLALFLTIGHVHYAICVVQQMCDHFKINCLSLTKRDTEASRQHLLRESTDSLDKTILSNTDTIASHDDVGSISRSTDNDQLG